MPLLAADISATAVAVLSVAVLRMSILGWSPGFAYVFCAVGYVTGLMAFGMYPAVGIHPAQEMKRQLLIVGVLCSSFGVSSMIGPLGMRTGQIAAAVLFVVWSIAAPTLRSLVRSAVKRFDWWTQPVVVVGGADRYEELADLVARHRNAGFRLSGYFGDARHQWLEDASVSNQFLGDIGEIGEFVRENKVYWVIIDGAESVRNDPRLPAALASIPHRLYPRPSPLTPPVSIWEGLVLIDGEGFFHQCDRLLLPHNRLAKRATDLLFGTLIGLVALPAVALIAILVKLSSKGPVFYKSPRIGTGNREFMMTKFRTMRVDAEPFLAGYLDQHPERREEWETQQKLKNDPRVTAIGWFLRRTSLDELPQLLDVLQGRMSLVGPRPILLDEPEKYGSHLQSFCRMLPGMTGLWQVSGRNRIPYEQRLALVSYYVQNWSPWYDLYLLAKTAKVVISGDGAF